MPRITFVKNKAPLQVPEGSNLMEKLLASQIPVASSCKGNGICGKCRIKIIDGADKLETPSDLEINTMQRNNVETGSRLSCQLSVTHDLKIDTDYW
jgi:2Fe-2S ferredoxin